MPVNDFCLTLPCRVMTSLPIRLARRVVPLPCRVMTSLPIRLAQRVVPRLFAGVVFAAEGFATFLTRAWTPPGGHLPICAACLAPLVGLQFQGWLWSTRLSASIFAVREVVHGSVLMHPSYLVHLLRTRTTFSQPSRVCDGCRIATVC